MKPCINLTIDKQLLETLEKNRLDRIQKDEKVISRSAYISELISKGLGKK